MDLPRRLVLVLALVGCGDRDGSAIVDAPPPTDGRTADGMLADPSAPRIVTLSANVGTMRETDRLVITAIVTDPDGIDDVIGGSLVDPSSGRTYGAFATAAAEGAYEIELLWNDINTVSAIDAPMAGTARTFRAEFFDVAAHAATRDLEVTLDCEDAPRSACGGACVDLATNDDHCGTCAREVTARQDCVAGEPVCAFNGERVCTDDCYPLTDIRHCGTCGNACPAANGALVVCRLDDNGSGSCFAGGHLEIRDSCANLCGPSYTCTGNATWQYYSGGNTSWLSRPCTEVPPATQPGGYHFVEIDCSCVAN